MLNFAEGYKDRSVIVVSKKEHLLYYCENGRIVENDYWQGFMYSFPVKVSLAGRWYRTPEGLMFVDRKNDRSQFTLFLGLSVPGDYGIHGAATRLASFLDKMETLDHDFSFVTKKDDTRGCVAVENRVIKYLFARVDVKTLVWILP
ncbi:MAG: L,D-transpeptidase [Candidatus Margulisbacteria bacterium]|nr:L,D-transpeptidase [Candidatus Margulisiibacteriota bacterium]